LSSPPRSRVAICFHEPRLGGATRSVERIVPLLADRGWEHSFWVPRPSDLYDELAGRGWDVDGAPHCIAYSARAWMLPPGIRRRMLDLPAYVRRFRRFLAERSPDLVHANSILTLAEGLIASRQGHAVLLHAHEMLPDKLRVRLMRHAAWRRFDAVVAVSQASASTLAWRGHRPLIVYEAAPVPDRPVAVRAEPRPFTVGTVAVVSTRKGSDLFVEAARLLSERGDGFRFEMVGAPNDELEREWAQGLLERARGIGVEHAASADVHKRFETWDAFVLPSRADPFPIALLEAMASGLPVIGARRDGIAEQISPGAGILVDAESAQALADAIASLAAAPRDVRERIGAGARARVATNFTLAHQAAAMDRAYRTALAAAAGRRRWPTAGG
jgi:glycosyltransferase involved in cell wall biosynthesis